MKKFVIAVVAAAALNTVSAESCASNFSGFYAGLQAGINYAHGKSTKQGPAIKDKLTDEEGTNSFIGGLFTGYGMGIGQCMYVGGEIYGNLGANNLNLTHLDSDVEKLSAKNNGNFGVKVRLGYVASPQAMIFLGLGLEHSQWKVKYEHIDGILARGVEREYKRTISRVAFSPSVGADVFMTKNFFVRGEFTYVAPVGGKGEGKARDGSPVQFKSYVNQRRFTLGLGYKF